MAEPHDAIYALHLIYFILPSTRLEINSFSAHLDEEVAMVTK